jgi:hypothetical protein
MSIEPEVPYSFSDDDSADEFGGSWRDPSISQTPREFRTATTIQATNSRGTPNDYWVLPGWNIENILGHGRSRISEIEKKTGSHIAYNEEKRQIDIWGEPLAIQETKNYLNLIYSKLNETDTRNMRKTKKWGKPERELTEREKRRSEKKLARLAEEKSFQGVPAMPQPYSAIFCLPGDMVPIIRLTGENDRLLNKIRAECKAYLWYDQTEDGFMISGGSDEVVRKAASRIRNHYLKSVRFMSPFNKSSLLIMQQPKENWVIKFRRLPKNFEFGDNYSASELELLFKSTYLCEVGKPGVPTALDLIQLDDSKNNTESHALSETARGMSKRNAQYIREQLEPGLERLRLTDWEIRLKFRFGQIHLSNFRPKENVFLPIERVSEKLFRNAGTESSLAPCLSTSRSGLDSLFEYLSIHGEEFSDSPKTSFTIHADQHAQLHPPRLPGDPRPPPRGDRFRTILKTNFTSEGHYNLWNCITNSEDFVTINCVDIESRYSWDLKLQCAQRLLSDLDTPHGKFVKQLRLNPNTGRLIMMIDEDDYDPEFTVQKTVWKYGWGEYIIEVCMDEVWFMDEINHKHKELPVDLSEKEPIRTIFKVSLYKEDWINRFAQNLYLSVGEAPNWNVRSFVASDDENVTSLMAAAKELSDILSSHIPLYWDHHVNSLV